MARQKSYDVFYVIKMNGTEHLHLMEQIEAVNAKEACKTCKSQVQEKTGRNAFRTTTRMSEDDINRYYGGEINRNLPSRKA